MKLTRIFFAALICAVALGFMSCANRSTESSAERRDSIIIADSAKAAAAVDSINAFNDSITRARQAVKSK